MTVAPSVPDALLRKRFAKKRKPMGWVDHFPIEDPRQTQNTLSPAQLRISLLALRHGTGRVTCIIWRNKPDYEELVFGQNTTAQRHLCFIISDRLVPMRMF